MKNFDHWLKSDTLQQKYNSSEEAQNARKIDTNAQLADAITKITKLTENQENKLIKIQKNQGHHHHLFGWLSHKRKS